MTTRGLRCTTPARSWTTFTAFASSTGRLTARLVVRRVRNRPKAQELFPLWRHHPPPHAIIEAVSTDLIDGARPHLPSGRFAANSAGVIWVPLTGNLLRTVGTLTRPKHVVARRRDHAPPDLQRPRAPWRGHNDSPGRTRPPTGPGPKPGPR